jgi:hypothetical protein
MKPTHALVLLVMASFAMTAQAEPKGNPLSLQCITSDKMGCGCSVTLDNLPSTQGCNRHAFSGLSDGDPLLLNINNNDVTLVSDRAKNQTFSFSQGDSWTETYRYNDTMQVRIDYRPAPDSCPAEKKADDGCEYFDVRARMTVTPAQGKPSTFTGTGACGC